MKVLMTAPINRSLILIYKLIGTSLVSIIQVYLFLLVAIAFEVRIPWIGLLEALPSIAISAYSMSLIGLIMASKIRSLENFAGVMNFVIFPSFFLSSALYPLWQLRESSEVLYLVSSINPFTHLVELVRFGLHGQIASLSTLIIIATSAVLSGLIGYLFKSDS